MGKEAFTGLLRAQPSFSTVEMARSLLRNIGGRILVDGEKQTPGAQDIIKGLEEKNVVTLANRLIY